MYKLELDKSEYYDFIVTGDEDIFRRDYNDFILFHIDVTKNLSSITGTTISTGITLNEISLNGYDNGLLNDNILPTYSGTVTVNNPFSYTFTQDSNINNFISPNGFNSTIPVLIEQIMPISLNGGDNLFMRLYDKNNSSFNILLFFTYNDGISGYFNAVNTTFSGNTYNNGDLISLYLNNNKLSVIQNGIVLKTFINTGVTPDYRYGTGLMTNNSTPYTIDEIRIYGQKSISTSPLSAVTGLTIPLTGITYTNTIEPFKLYPVSGSKTNTTYEIDGGDSFIGLNGGFYQGYYKLHNFNIEYQPPRYHKGWTVNMMLHCPTSGTTTGITLNDVYSGNTGFIYYNGTRSESKYSYITPIESQLLANEFGFQYNDRNTQLFGVTGTVVNSALYTDGTGNEPNFLFTSGNTFVNRSLAISGTPYNGYFYVLSGMTFAGRATSSSMTNLTYYNQSNNVLATGLTYYDQFVDITNNAFGIRITPDGRIGYRTVYKTEECYTGATQNPTGITNNSFVDYTEDCQNYSVGKVITKYFTIEESYTKASIINQLLTPKNLLISITYSRYDTLDTECELEYLPNNLGQLCIYVNGFKVYQNDNMIEPIPHALDTDYRVQEAVPYNLSFGGGTQGLYEAIFDDITKETDGVLQKFFAGSFTGGVKFIEMYSVPLYAIEIQDIVKNKLQSYNLYYPLGGRHVFIKNSF